jgi:hypothetical protein
MIKRSAVTMHTAARHKAARTGDNALASILGSVRAAPPGGGALNSKVRDSARDTTMTVVAARRNIHLRTWNPYHERAIAAEGSVSAMAQLGCDTPQGP